MDAGYAQYVVVSYADGYTLKNTHVWVDGVDVSEAMTPVTDDESVTKWEITSLNPAEVKATNVSYGLIVFSVRSRVRMICFPTGLTDCF